jgi:hypothetical protein
MGVVSGRVGARRGPRPERAPAPSAAAAPSTRELAWLAALPTALVVLAAIVLLGPPLGRGIFGGQAVTFWGSAAPLTHPEPSEQARYLLSLGAPLLLVAFMEALRRWTPGLARGTRRAAILAIEAAGVAFAVTCLLVQRTITFGPIYEGPQEYFQRGYFTPATLVVSLVGAGALLAALRDAGVRARFAALARESRERRIAATALAVLLTGVWLLHAFYTEHTINAANYAVFYHLHFTFDETAAVLDGRSPLVNFAPQYGFLWPYPVAAGMALLGASVGAFTGLMCLVSGLGMLAIFGALRRVTRSAASALLLFAPFLATAFFLERGPLDERYTPATVYSTYPMRFAGPFLLVWLLARHLAGERPRRAWPLFVLGGLVVLNNLDHGVPALGALAVALLVAEWRPAWARLGRLGAEAALGLLGALGLVSLLTLLRAGSLPQLTLLLRFARMFANAGFGMLPMPAIGFHLVLYLTYVAALGVAAARAIDRDGDRVLTGLLAWIGIFGLGAGSYYVGRSHPEVLINEFGTWALALALLLVVVLRRLAARPSRWPSPAEAACVAGFAIAACSLAQTPAPWSQIARLQRSEPATLRPPPDQAFVAAHTHRGERVAILVLLGHRMGYDLGVADVAPYTGIESMPAVQQLTETIQALRAAGGRKLFLSTRDTTEAMREAVRQEGFRLAASGERGLQLWVDARGA